MKGNTETIQKVRRLIEDALARTNSMPEMFEELGRGLAQALAEEREKALEEAAQVAQSYFKERVCGDECLTRTVASDILCDIRALKE